MNSDEWSIADDPGQEPLASGTQVGSYRIESQLGEGGMGIVFRALDTKLNRAVAIKVLSDGSRMRPRAGGSSARRNWPRR